MGVWQLGHQGQSIVFSKKIQVLTRFGSYILVGLFFTIAIAACSSQLIFTSFKKKSEITLVSFAVTRSAHEAIIPKFVEKWKQQTGQTVRFKRSYGGSGVQTRAVIDGLDADVVHLALALDTQKIEKAGLIQPGWEKELPNGSIVSKSVAALVTRQGNPKAIYNWTDLARSDIQWVTADPKTSGVARWNFMALWNAAVQQDSNPIQAQKFISQAFKNVVVLTRDAREASDVFLHQGQGDAMINYENEIILAAKKGETAQYVIPDVNISIENPVAVVDKNVDKHGNREVAEAFTQFLYSPEAQAEFVKAGFRTVNPTIGQKSEFSATFPKVKNLATIKDYGGWKDAQKQFFADGAIFDQIRAKSVK